MMKKKASLLITVERLLGAIRLSMLLGILLAVAGGGYYIVEHSQPVKAKMVTSLKGGDGVKTKIYGFTMREKSANNDLLTVEAREVTVTDAEMDMDSVKVSFVSKAKSESSFELSAQNAIMDNESQNAVFSGDVSVRTSRPTILKTQRLNWLAEKRVVTTDSPVRIEQRAAVITGNGLVMELDKQTIRIGRTVRAVFD
jgi:LPS export ABC transporter protein LptC